jgi:hypothetical protein
MRPIKAAWQPEAYCCPRPGAGSLGLAHQTAAEPMTRAADGWFRSGVAARHFRPTLPSREMRRQTHAQPSPNTSVPARTQAKLLCTCTAGSRSPNRLHEARGLSAGCHLLADRGGVRLDRVLVGLEQRGHQVAPNHRGDDGADAWNGRIWTWTPAPSASARPSPTSTPPSSLAATPTPMPTGAGAARNWRSGR